MGGVCRGNPELSCRSWNMGLLTVGVFVLALILLILIGIVEQQRDKSVPSSQGSEQPSQTHSKDKENS
jgi:hypothetical protein